MRLAKQAPCFPGAWRMRIAWTLILAPGVFIAGCDPAASGSGDVVRDTIDGVEHVTSTGPGAWAEGAGWRVDSAGTAIGAMEGADPYVFGQISAVAVASDRRIWVADAQAREIRVFSETGEFRQRVGRDGEGPGEFRHVGGLARAPDGVGAMDGRLGRVTVFDASGEVVRLLRLQRSYMILESHAVMTFDPAGRFFDRARLSARPGMDSIGAIVYGSEGEVVDTVFLATVAQDQLFLERDGVPLMSVPRPYAPRPSLAFGPDGAAYLARGAEYRVDVFSPAGDTVRVIHRPVERPPVTAAERDSALARIERVFEEQGGRVPPGTELPERKPAILGLEVDVEGNLWVRAPGPSGSGQFQWSVHDPEGRYLGDVTTPVMAVDQIGRDFVAGTTRDELGVPRAVVLPLLKGGDR